MNLPLRNLFAAVSVAACPCLQAAQPFPSDAGLINVKEAPYFAKGDGVTDDTQAIQRAVGAGSGESKFVYFPAGTYIVSKTIYTRKLNSATSLHGDWDTDGWGAGWRANTTITGESSALTTIRLKDNLWTTDPSYSSTDFRPQAILFTSSQEPDSSLTATGNKAFRHNVLNLTLDIGSGNPGAVGIDYLANNRGTIKNVTVKSSDPAKRGFSGIRMDRAWPGPALLRDVKIVGFRTGIQMIGHYQYGITAENLTLENQSVVGIDSARQTIAIRKLTSVNSVPVIRPWTQGLVTLLDVNCNGGNVSNAAVDNSSQAAFYLRNITSSGYGSALKLGTTLQPGASIVEQAKETLSANPSSPGALKLPIEESPVYKEADLTKWKSVGVPNGTDDTVRIQQAFDSNSAVIYFPHSGPTGAPAAFKISAAIQVPANVRLVHGAECFVSRVGGYTGPIFIVNAPAPNFIVLQHFKISGSPTISHRSSRTVALKHCSLGGSAYQGFLGAGNLHVDDCMGSKFTIGSGQKMWGRQVNPEFQSDQIVNEGGMVWVLGYKSETSIVSTEIVTRAGGFTEILGGMIYPLSSGSGISAFVSEDSNVSITMMRNSGNKYTNMLRDTRNGVVGTVPDTKNSYSLITAYTESYPLDVATARYDFTGTSTLSSDAHANSVASSFSNGSGYTNTVNENNTRKVSGAGAGGLAENSLSAGEFFTFTVSAKPGHLLDISSLALKARRGSSSPDKISVFFLPTRNGVTESAVKVIDGVGLGTGFSWYSSGPGATAFRGLSSGEVRVVFHGNQQGSGTNFVDEVQVNGLSYTP